MQLLARFCFRLATVLRTSFTNQWAYIVQLMPRVRGGVTPIWVIWGCATQQGTVFASLSLEQGLQISVSVWNRVYSFPFRLWNTVGVTLLLPESHCKRTLLLFLLRSCCMFTQTRCFRLEGQLCLTFFSLEQAYLFSQFSLEQGSKIVCLSGTGSGSQALSVTPPILNWGNNSPPSPPGSDATMLHTVVPKCYIRLAEGLSWKSTRLLSWQH